MKQVNKRFGQKTLRVLELMETVPEWEKYVTDKTAEVLKYLRETQSIEQTKTHFGMEYTTVRSHILRGIDRIENKKTYYRRNGQTELAQELFELMENTPNWEEYVTHYEAELAKNFKKVKNFYKLGKQLNIAPSNIAGTLYVTTQKIGVIGKIKERIPQTQRRDFSVLSENEKLGEN